MSPAWTTTYLASLEDHFEGIVDGLDDRIDDIAAGRVAPALDDITLGSGRKVRAAVLFFDIVGFSKRIRADLDVLKDALYMLDCVIPMVMHVVFDHGGYVEKNTGDGVMAIIGVGDTDQVAADTALDIATISLYVVDNIVNPWLSGRGIDPVSARITLDLGSLLLARIGTPKGTAKHHRNFLTAVGTSANLASKLQDRAGADEIWTGHLIQDRASAWRKGFFRDKTPAGWTWTWVGGNREGETYRIWHYKATRKDPSIR